MYDHIMLFPSMHNQVIIHPNYRKRKCICILFSHYMLYLCNSNIVVVVAAAAAAAASYCYYLTQQLFQKLISSRCRLHNIVNA